MGNENKAAVVAAIWQDPEKAFGCRFKPSGLYLINERNSEYNERGKIRLAQTRTGENIMVFYNGSSREEKTDIFTHLERYVLHTAGFAETLKRLAGIYGVSLKYSEEQRRRMNREALAREIAPCLIESLRKNPTGTAGRYITETRGLTIDAHFGELTAESLKKAKDHLRNRGISWDEEDFKDLQLTDWNIRQGYNIVVPYYNNGIVIGFMIRKTTNIKPKYLKSADAGRGYCDKLKIGKPVFIVEGEMDAIRLIQAYADDADAPNILAIGGAKINENLGKLLKRHNIDVVTYIPDVEYNEQGERKTDITNNAIRAFQSVKVDDEPVINTLFVSELETPQGASLNNYKIDVDAYGKGNGNNVLIGAVEGNAADWFVWEFRQLEQWESKADSWDSWNIENKFRDKFRDIYHRAGIWERQPIRNYIKAHDIYAKYGVTPQVLDDSDELTRDKEYKNRIAAISSDLVKAVEDGANPVCIAKIAEQLHEAQATNSRDEWERQINISFSDQLANIMQQPASLKTKWEIGIIRKRNTLHPYRKTERINFTPSDLTVFCAPTSHGKTMILFQSALDCVRDNPDKTFMMISCEESQSQLLGRALSAYITTPTTENGTTENGGYCFINKTRRQTIAAVIADSPAPMAYADESGAMFVSEHYKALQGEIKRQIQQYGTQIHPRLKLIHTDASANSICSNITRFVREAQEQGKDVGAVFLDYMQLLNTDSKHFSRHDEMKDICKILSNCAKANGIPIVIAAQLNREIYRNGIDDVSVANIGEGADIERIAKDVFLVWQIDKTPLNLYVKRGTEKENIDDDLIKDAQNIGKRAQRIFTEETLPTGQTGLRLKTGYLYIEHLKARYGETGGWGLLPYDGESGQILENDIQKMQE